MAKKHYFGVVDCETTVDDLVADFAMVITDRKGSVITQCATLVKGIFDDSENHPLFVDPSVAFDNIWSRNGQGKRYDTYNRMLDSGTRMLASVSAINRWIDKAVSTYNPILTAYNLPFDVNKCENTGIDLTGMPERFCLWAGAYTRFSKSRDFRQFVLDNHEFNKPTALGNMTYKTNAEIMARFLLKNPDMPDEPHTALEDIIDYELPILKAVVKGKSRKELQNFTSYNWRECQVRDWFKAK
jgi:hypothetical protein